MPQYIKDHYKNPVGSHCPPPNVATPRSESNSDRDAKDDDQFLECVILMQESILREKGKDIESYLSERKRKRSETEKPRAAKRPKSKEGKKRRDSEGGTSTDSDCR